MPRNPDLKKVMVIGSGPIVIGQAAEFDYAGTQACRALREEGLSVVLVNSNPATIMTDQAMADAIYIEPLTIPTLKRIIEKERPDSLLSTLGGQTGLTLSMELAEEGFLEEMGVRLLGADPATIHKAEDRKAFKETMEQIGQPVIPSVIANEIETALDFAAEMGYPLIIRPAFTLGGTGGGIANDEAELIEIVTNGLRLSPIHQVLVERSVAGWKEIEFEVMRDAAGNAITVCSMENFDPVGVHTGDSIVIAPAVTLADKEYQMLRTAALDIVTSMGVEGGCNCQFALNPDSFEYAVIEVNPRVSRSSALASKATGYPIAKVATKIAIGYTLGEIQNAITKKTCACFEPALDYVVVKVPKWPFDKFIYARRTLGTQMKATGEVMAIGTSFEQAVMKAVRGAEIKLDSLNLPELKELSDHDVLDRLYRCDDRRMFVVFEAIKRGISLQEIHAITKIDRWFLGKLANLARLEQELEKGRLTDALYRKAKRLGYTDSLIKRLSGCEIERPLLPAYKMVDTCAGEFPAETPYFYSTYDEENEAAEFIEHHKDGKKTVIVFGAGPIRIGQGIEFDYASVHCVWALKKCGYDVVIVNNNPETVSTDFDTADRLYFEPLTAEDVEGILETEKPYGVVVAFGGQTAIKLTHFLSRKGVNILGTSADSIDRAEDRERFEEMLAELGIERPQGKGVLTLQEALDTANALGYPVLVRPSYVLGGQNMSIAFSDNDVREFMGIILSQGVENPVLVDKYLMGIEVEVDAICDGKDILIPGIMRHIERAGIHSGDSIAVYPAWDLGEGMEERIIDCSRRMALALDTHGLINIQYVIYQNELYVIEVNPRSSRTVPYLSKVTGVPMVELATRAMLGEPLETMGYGTGLYPSRGLVAVKVPVFSFEKLSEVDVNLGPEMKSTGEVLGIAPTLQEALFKGLTAAGYQMKRGGGIFVTVKNGDKVELPAMVAKFRDLGFTIYATEGTRKVLMDEGIDAIEVAKIHESSEQNVLTLLESGKVDYVISTPSKGRGPASAHDELRMRRKAVERSIPCLTAIDTANALADTIWSGFTQETMTLVNINRMRGSTMKLRFTKMHGCSNDYIYFNCFDQKIADPAALSVRLSNRHTGVGGDGVILICPSDRADAKMRIFNQDGSEGRMCGNGIRCVAKYVYDSGIAKKETLDIDTLSGVKRIELSVEDGKAVAATVDMGAPILLPEKIPVRLDGESVVARPVTIGGRQCEITCVSMGNPHCVMFLDKIDDLDLEKVGPIFEHCELFPDRVNTEFVRVIDDHTLQMRVWERGSGETMACGTGTCAAVVAAVLNGYCKKNEDVTVHLLGGDLTIRYTDQTVYMTGPAQTVFEGEVEE